MKALFFHIIKTGEESFLVQEDKLPAFYGLVHYHPEVQITLIKKGSGVRLIGDRVLPFGPGTLMIISENVPHVIKSNPAEDGQMVEDISIYFNREAFGPKFFSIPEMQSVRSLLDLSKGGLDVGGTTRTYVEEKLNRILYADGFERFIKFLEILLALSKSSSLTELNPNRKDYYLDHRDSERLNQVFNYVFSNFDKPILLKEMAGMTHFTVNGFCRYFKNKTRRSFVTFLNEVRISKAMEQLRAKDWPVSRVAMESGFSNLSHFNRQFKAIHGMTPSEYRNQIKLSY
jgi:AraC-like DNA-binding protein